MTRPRGKGAKRAEAPPLLQRAAAGQPRSEWQCAAVRDLLAVASEHPQEVVLGTIVDADGLVRVELELVTDGLVGAPKAPKLLASEPFVIWVRPENDQPPVVSVTHERFLGVAHVLSGYQLCLYLDPSREWDPADGIRGLLARLWDWLRKVAADEFDPDTALFHAVGGVPHVTAGTPSVVVRDLAVATDRVNTAFLHRRTWHRFDLVPVRADGHDLEVPVIRLRRDLPVGAGTDTLDQLMARLDLTQGLWSPEMLLRQSLTRTALLSAREVAVAPPCKEKLTRGVSPGALISTSTRLAELILACVERNPRGSHQYVLLAVPHPSGGPHHLLCLRLKPELADQLRDLMATSKGRADPFRLAAVSSVIAMEWCRVSDERAAVTTRRDVGRPVTALAGAEVYLWGVGGIGSWMGEFVARAGARRIVVCDPGHVSGGLLVRQNYTEADIGSTKADALARRLRALRDDLDVSVLGPTTTLVDLAAADLIIDATVSRGVTRVLDALTRLPGRRVAIAQVSTDVGSGALGMLIFSSPAGFEVANADQPLVSDGDPAHEGLIHVPPGLTLTAMDRAAGAAVTTDSTLEDYRVLWRDPVAGEEFVPTRGCSIPTFHGSAADLAAIAGTLVNFVGLTLRAERSGTHLVALPHSGVTPAHRYLPHLDDAGAVEADVAA